MRRILFTTTTLAAALAAPAAHAYFAPGATIASASLTLREQGDDSSMSPDLSKDGRYVVFRTTSRNLFPPEVRDPAGRHYRGGVFRRDLQTGELELVALGDLRSDADDALLRRGADSPSVNADGRYVAFSTAEALVPEDTNDRADVYVRDMAPGGGYELVSAPDGANVPFAYGPLGSSEASPGVSISDDGNRIAFRTVDDVAGGMEPFQVLVRDRAARTTRLVTHLRGAASAAVGGALGQAAISGDGSTVVWTGRFASAQVATVPNETLDAQAFSYLWQREGGPTRRVTGPTDPDDPGCVSYVPSDIAQGPCYGPLADVEQGLTGIIGQLPAISADGYRVAFLTSTSPRPRVTGNGFDLFVTDMRPGVTRKAGTTEYTRDDPIDQRSGASLIGLALSPDGRWVAFTTTRLRFPSLTFTTGVKSVFGTEELYVLDLETRRVQRAAVGAGGGDLNAGVASQLSLSQDGRRLAFVSGADNLFFGDANQRNDVFVVDRLDSAPPPTAVEEPPIEAPIETFDPPPVTETRRLQVSLKRAKAYEIRLQVKVPVKGSLKVEVRGRIPDSDGRPRGAVKLLASKTVKVGKPGTLRVDLALAKRYRSALKRAGKLSARATTVLTPTSGGSAYERALTVRFQPPR